MEDELIVQQNEYERRTPNKNTLLWYDRYSQVYESIAETSSPYEAFTKLVLIRNEIESQLERAKKSLEKFSEELKAILINEDELERGSELEQLHHNISLGCLLTFTSATFGNFREGGMNLKKSNKELQRIERDFPNEKHYTQPLEEIVREYLRETNQKGNRGLIQKIPKAFELRFLADKLTYQKTALDIHIQRLLLFDFPQKVPTLSLTERERLTKFLSEQQEKRNSTSIELFTDIYFLIKRLEQDKEEPHLFNSKGKLVYSVAAGIALDIHKDNPYNDFAKRWKKTEKNPNGVSKSWLEKKIKEVYEGVISR